MTDEEWRADVTKRLDQITKSQTELKAFAQRWEEPPPGQTVSRIQQIDRLLVLLWAGKVTGRVILWIAGFIIAIGAAVPHVRGWIGK